MGTVKKGGGSNKSPNTAPIQPGSLPRSIRKSIAGPIDKGPDLPPQSGRKARSVTNSAKCRRSQEASVIYAAISVHILFRR